ncbi:LAFE_0C03510g1_1 [Lachancea fermentati]|uniref:non-specific serine/threonine protein kinase n=1 Tax=Lachancea fermentati TaxID=4955 RepID=A0A1G4M9A7_LACFM|nr:LAFE_0C03510g1_1 [Lachancea fermentati]
MSDFLRAICCCTNVRSSYVYVNDQKFTIQKLLGEGGFSFVYLVLSSQGKEFALKKIRCPFGNIDSLSQAMREINSYKRFQSPFITRLVDSQVVQEKDGSKTVFILLPFFCKGSLQDVINRHLLDGTSMSEDEVVRIATGIARGLHSIHDATTHEDSEQYSMVSTAYTDDVSLMNELELDTFDDSTQTYAHRDLKPANVMISAEGIPVICDLGSCSPAKIEITSRQNLIHFEEWRSEHCTLAFIAPELLNVKLHSVITEKCDIWSLGCTLYTLCFGISPFEREEQVSGASVRYAIATGKYSIPSKPKFNGEFIRLIQQCLSVNPDDRPSSSSMISGLVQLQSDISSS